MGSERTAGCAADAGGRRLECR